MYIAKHFDNNYFCSLVINMQWFWQSVCFSSGNACCCTWLCTLSHKQNLVWVRHDCRTLLRERTAMCIDRRITLCSGYSCNSWRQTDVNSRVRFLLFWRIYRAERSDITLESWMASLADRAANWDSLPRAHLWRDSAGTACLPSIVNVSANFVSFLARAVLQQRESIFYLFFRLAVFVT